MSSSCVHVGVDVGGTNTDAVVLKGDLVVGWSKQVTTADVTTGVGVAISSALEHAREQLGEENINVLRTHIGTTHFVNAVVQRKHLAKVSVVRLCGPASLDLPPFSDFPEDLKQVICGSVHLVDGGFEFDGVQEIKPINEDQINDIINQLKEEKCKNVMISGVFSPVNAAHEKQVQELFKSRYPEASVTISSDIGEIGLLERENAAVLNECLKPLSIKTVTALRSALDTLGLTCPFYLTQNDGTLISAEKSIAQPVLTFASGPTNSMRGAAFLSGLKDAVVVDVGGTTCDIGVLIGGFPKQASRKGKVGNVRTNFRMPDVLSIGLGGGSKVHTADRDGELQVAVGPDSVGYRLELESVVFGGSTVTTSDLAVAGGLAQMGDKQRLAQHGLTPTSEVVIQGLQRIRQMIEDSIDQVKTSAEEVPVVLVGGGSILISDSTPLKGTSRVYKPPNFHVANAVGAALSQVSGSVDYTVDLSKMSREEAITQAKNRASQAALLAGADKNTIQVVDVTDVPLAYLPGNATRVSARAVGNLLLLGGDDSAVSWKGNRHETGADAKKETVGAIQLSTSTGKSLTEDWDIPKNVEEKKPTIDPSTGEWIVSEWDVECMAVGAGILGCGGGGNPHVGKLLALNIMKEGHKIRIITPERAASLMKDGEVSLAVAVMGAPTILVERLLRSETKLSVEGLSDLYDKGEYDNGDIYNKDGIEIVRGDGITYIDDYKPTQRDEPKKNGRKLVSLFSAEIGGLNSMAPLCTAPLMDLPIVDCDCMGRAFPEIQHNTPMIYGNPPYPACVADYNGKRSVIVHTDSAKGLENYCRKVCVEMGCAAGISLLPLSKDDLWNPVTGGKVVPHSLSRAWRLGNAVWQARKAKTNTIEAILGQENGKLLFIGKISDVLRKTEGGFARGEMKLDGINKFSNQNMIILFQNENLVAKMVGKDGALQVLACVPDLISLVDHDQGEPIPTEELRYGLRVAVLVIPSHPLLTTPQALQVVGPQGFGYPVEEVKYEPFGQFASHDPIPPK